MAEVTKWGLDENIARNVEIVKAVLNGRSPNKVAIEFGLSRERTRQLTTKYCRIANREAYGRMPKCLTVNMPWLQAHRDEFIPYLPNGRGKPTAVCGSA